MTIKHFPNMPLHNPVHHLGVAHIQSPPQYAVRDMNAAHGRFINALSLKTENIDMPRSVLMEAKKDLARYGHLISYVDHGGITLVDNETVVQFIHYVTGYPKAWVLAWNVLTHVASFTGVQLDRTLARVALKEHIEEVTTAMAAGYNREY
jgi:hypothetical protein